MSTPDRDDLRRRATLSRNPGVHQGLAGYWSVWCHPDNPCLFCRPAPSWVDVLALCDALDTLDENNEPRRWVPTWGGKPSLFREAQ